MSTDWKYDPFGLTEKDCEELLDLNATNADKCEHQSRASPLFPFKHYQAGVLKRALEKLNDDPEAKAIVVAMMHTCEDFVRLRNRRAA